MKIAFISANREQLPDPVVPLGLAYLMGGVPERHSKTLIDLCWEPKPLDYLKNALDAFAPDAIALGLRNIQNSDYSGDRDNIDYYSKVVQAIRQSSNAPIIAGGGGFSVIPQGLMEKLKPDYGISGEGESAFLSLIDRLERGIRDAAGIGSVYWFDRGILRKNPPAPAFQDLDALPPPDRRYIDPRHYQWIGIESVQTKRGCNLSCDYCTYPTIEGRSVRQRDPARVADEMFSALELHPNINHFFIVDSNFNIPPRHAKAICRELISRSWNVPWTCYANPLGFDVELAELMAQARCVGMEIGSDSGCDEVLDRLHKGFRTDKIRQIQRLCAETGLRDCHTFILGTQGETIEDVQRTLQFIHDLQPFAAILMFWTDDDEALDPALAAKRRVFRRQMDELIKREWENHPRWIVPSQGHNFDVRLFRLLRKRGLHGPLWQHIRSVDKGPQAVLPELSVGAAPGRRLSHTGRVTAV